jgi:acetyl-CoA C-acetyltransferase
MQGIYIAAAKRTPIGRLSGALAGVSAVELGAQTIRAMFAELDFDPSALDEVIVGQVLTGGAGQNPARQTALHAGIPVSVPAMTANMVCGGGQKSLHLSAQAIKAGDAELVLAAGQDSMTQAPHILRGVRSGGKAGDRTLEDMMILDGLWDAFHDMHMGETVEHLAQRFQVTREEQDEFAFNSQRKAGRALSEGKFVSQIIPVNVKDAETVTHDEHPRPRTTLAELAAMKPAFRSDGTITAGNASGVNDGAAAVLIGSEKRLAELGLKPLARVASYASAALEPMDMGLGPAAASRKALKNAGWSSHDLDVLEVNEAFAAQAIIINREMGWDPDRVNVNGGAIALGHPLAGSGCRIVVTLLHEMLRSNARRGLATMCIGGGQGVAICLEGA